MSIRTGAPVGEEILDRLPHTAILAAGGVALALGLGLVIGVAAALSRRVITDRLLTAVSLLSASTPSYWLALMLMLVFSVALGWLPAIGVGTPGPLRAAVRRARPAVGRRGGPHDAGLGARRAVAGLPARGARQGRARAPA